MSLANEIRAIQKSIQDDLAQYKKIAELNQENDDIEDRLEDIATRVEALEQFNNVNFNELLGQEIDKAILANVEQSVFEVAVEEIKTQLQDSNSELSQAVADSLTETGALKTSINNINDYLSAFNETYTIRDISDNEIKIFSPINV